MMKRVIMTAFAVGLAAVISGCASVQVAEDVSGQKLVTSNEQNVAHIYGSNWGVYFLCFPFLTGNTEKVGSIAFAKDTVTVPAVAKMVAEKSKDLKGTKSVDMVSNASSMFFPPFFFVKNTSVSANSVK